MTEDPRLEIDLQDRRRFLDLALELAGECRAVIRDTVAARVDVEVKPDRSLVTTADLRAEEVFRERARQRLPEAGVIGEEFGDSDPDAALQWIIDPVDGTAEFANGLPTWGTIIALHYRGRPLVGVLDHPDLRVTCHGAFGLGAFVNGRPVRTPPAPAGGRGMKERISTPSRASWIRYTDDDARFRALTRSFPNFRSFHTCYGHVCAVTGGVDAALEWKTRLWDIAATQVVVEEAGGAYRLVEEIDHPGTGMLYSAVFGRPDLVESISALLTAATDGGG